jgi:hypothetical protein
LSELATRADNLKTQFDREVDFKQWRGNVREAARWAREADRLIDKRTGGTQLNMMIPINELPEMVKDVLKTIKATVKPFSSGGNPIEVFKDYQEGLYRNKEVFDKTGFWLGKDGKWRYEVSDEGLKIRPEILNPLHGSNIALDRVIDHPMLYKALPELTKTGIRVNRNLSSDGVYHPDGNYLEIKRPEKTTIIHELQHAVNDIMKSKFRGSSVKIEILNIIKKFFNDIRKVIKDPTLETEITKIDSLYGDKVLQGNNAKRLIEEVREVSKGYKEESMINEVVDKYMSESAFDNYMKDPGEMESRLSEIRAKMSAEQRKAEPPWETLETMLYNESARTLNVKMASSVKGTSMKLYSGVDLPEATKKIKSMLKPILEFMKEFDNSTNIKKFDLAFAAKQLKMDANRALIDQTESLLKEVRSLYPKESQRVIDRQRSAANGKGYGEIEYNNMLNEVFNGKSNEQVRLINAYILARRFNDIYSYRSGKEYKHQPGYGPDQSIGTTSVIEMVKDIPDNVWSSLLNIPEVKNVFGKAGKREIADAIRAGESFFEWHKKIIDDLVEAGLKTEAEGILLKSHDYRKFKTISVEKLYDFDYSTKLKGETIRSTNSGVDSLGYGSVKILDPDARLSAHEMAIRAYGSIANQAAKMEWKRLAEVHPDNQIVSTKQVGGWSPMPYFEQGIKRELYFNPVAAKYLVTRSHDVSQRLSMVLRSVTLAPLTRSLAVGSSPVWSTFVGLPMDVIHTLWSAKVWEADATKVRPSLSYPFYKTTKGDYKRVYSPYNPLSPLQLGKDMAETLTDVYTRGPLFENMAKHGLAMPFMSMRESRYIKGAKPPGDWAKLLDILSYHGVSMETWVRAASANRVIKNRAREAGVSYEEALKNNDIMYEAVHSARDRMDYNQGGWAIKALDQNGMIFLNAAILGTRTFWRSAVENPLDFAVRGAQLGVLATGITAMAWTMYEDIMKEVPTEGNEKNIVFPLFPNWINFKDENGDTRHFFAKLRMDPGAAFIYKMSDTLTRTYLYDRGLIKSEPDYEKIVDVLKTLGPVGISLPPLTQMGYDYTTNTSWWKDRQMYTDLGGRTLPWPQSKHEGEYDSNVSQLAKDVGSVTGLSPKRLQGSVSNVIPTNNEFVYMFGKAYEEAFSDVPESDRKRPWWVALADNPIAGRVIGITSPGYNRRQNRDQAALEEDLKNVVINGKFDMLATDWAWKGRGKREDVVSYINSQKDKAKFESLRERFIFIEKTKDLPHRSVWLGMWHMTPEVKAKELVKTLENSSEKEKAQLENELGQVNAIGGYVTDRFKEEYMRLKDKKHIQ